MKLLRKSETTTRTVTVRGLMPILFNRYAGDNTTKLTPRQKVYLAEDGESLVLPAFNIMSFLSATNTRSAPKVLYDTRKYKDIAQACLNYVRISPAQIPFLRGGEPVLVGDFRGQDDERSGLYVFDSVGRLKDGVPCPVLRPALPAGWTLSFSLSLTENDVVSEEMLQDLFVRGGERVGFGSFRGYFGLFEVVKWE